MKLLHHCLILALKQVTRHRVRTLLTVAGVTAGMFLFTAVETMQQSLAVATAEGAEDTTLVVYRENRFCPSTSRLPEHYLTDIESIDGVVEAIPVKITVNNCGASLDVITFRGVPTGRLTKYNPDLTVTDGSFESWTERDDAALVGHHFAARRGLEPGDTFEAVGVRVVVAGIVRSPHAQDNNVAYVHLPFLQQASRTGLGVVTQFNVRVASPDFLEPVGQEIDALFAGDTHPTDTRPESAFFAQTAHDLIELIGFTRWLGLGAVLAVLGIVGNALLLVARSRVTESAILQTLGYPRAAIGVLMLLEGAVLGLAGGALGALGATWFFAWRRFTLGNEGLTLALTPSPTVAVTALIVAMVLGVAASLWPAWVAARRPIVASLRNA